MAPGGYTNTYYTSGNQRVTQPAWPSQTAEPDLIWWSVPECFRDKPEPEPDIRFEPLVIDPVLARMFDQAFVLRKLFRRAHV